MMTKLDQLAQPFNLYKPLGFASGQLVSWWQQKNKLTALKAAPAGRLDPLASGVLLVLAGDQTKEIDRYLRSDKSYYVEVLFGLSSDTYDLLGVGQVGGGVNFKVEQVKDFLLSLPEKGFRQEMPPYSAYKVKGQSLFGWARSGRLAEVSLPVKDIKIHRCQWWGHYYLSPQQLLTLIQARVALVNGDFRQASIKLVWSNLLKQMFEEKFLVVRFQIRSSTGFYVRSLANYLGNYFNSGAVLLNLLRTSVAGYSLTDSQLV